MLSSDLVGLTGFAERAREREREWRKDRMKDRKKDRESSPACSSFLFLRNCPVLYLGPIMTISECSAYSCSFILCEHSTGAIHKVILTSFQDGSTIIVLSDERSVAYFLIEDIDPF